MAKNEKDGKDIKEAKEGKDAKEIKEAKEGKAQRSDVGLELGFRAERFAGDAERFKALGDPTRLAIVAFLLAARDGDAEASVSDIAGALTGKSGKEPGALSHHLKELRHAGLVAMTRDGKSLRYRVAGSAMRTLCDRLCCGISGDETSPAGDTTDTDDAAGEDERGVTP